METAEHSIVVQAPLAAAHQQWQTWVAQKVGPAQAPSGQTVTAPVPEELPPEMGEPEQGRIFFAAVDDHSTRVTMQLRYSPAAVQAAGLVPDYVSRRIGLYLQRFREFAES
ncbi:MAG TPA: hypothetical protein VG452_10280 [Egibacteraceae bacterium]|nr:hypothetical protein [Actinomycetota bacterium]HWB72597.1 hypothetical protein [Egibacteraceae bacterium]